MTSQALHALLAEFETPERLVEAARALRDAGLGRLDAFTPFPVEGLDKVLRFRDRRVPAAFLIGGVSGLIGGFLLQAGTTLDYPLWIGGRPLIALPALMLIMFELTVLGAVLAGIGMMFLANRLPRLNHPVFAAERFDLSRNDRFFLAILPGRGFDRDRAGKALAALHPRAIIDVCEPPLP